MAAHAFGSLSFQQGHQAAEKGLPGFRFLGVPRDKLPRVAVPFGLNFHFAVRDDRDLGRLAFPPKLVVLDLSHNNNLSDEGLISLASLKNLAWLDLRSTRVSNEGLKDLASLTNLTTLALPTDHISDRGLRALLPLKNLSELRATSVSDKGLEELASWQKLTAYK